MSPDRNPSQKAWQDLAATVREQLQVVAEQILPSMNAEAQAYFVDACRNALWLEQAADGYDAEVDRVVNPKTFD